MITAKPITHAFDGRCVLAAPALVVDAGKSLAVIGASGSGKTTLLAVLAGVLSPDAGCVVVDGQDVTAMTPAARDGFRGRMMGIVFQDLHLVHALSVRDNLRLAQSLAGCGRDDGAIDTLLAQLGLAHRVHSRPRHLSRGEAQRAAIARAVIHRPKLILADEPTSALDDENGARVIGLLRDVAGRSGAALIVATHDARVRGQMDAVLALHPPEPAGGVGAGAGGGADPGNHQPVGAQS